MLYQIIIIILKSIDILEFFNFDFLNYHKVKVFFSKDRMSKQLHMYNWEIIILIYSFCALTLISNQHIIKSIYTNLICIFVPLCLPLIWKSRFNPNLNIK